MDSQGSQLDDLETLAKETILYPYLPWHGMAVQSGDTCVLKF